MHITQDYIKHKSRCQTIIVCFKFSWEYRSYRLMMTTQVLQAISGAERVASNAQRLLPTF